MSHEAHKDFDSALSDLTWAIGASKGQFSFILAHCNYAGLRSRVMQRIQGDARIQVVQLLPGANLFDTVFSAVEKKNPEAVVVTGLESVSRPDDILAGANQAREEFRKNFPFPLVLWITDELMSSMIRVAPDLKSWATIVRFTFSKDELRDFFYKCVREYTHSVLSADSGHIQSGFPVFEDDIKELDALLRETFLRELSETESKSGFQADLYFLEGIRALRHVSLDEAVTGFEQTLALLSPGENPEKYGAVRICAGRCREKKGESGRALSDFKSAVEVFETSERYDLAAKYMTEQCLILRQTGEWDELEKTAEKALKLSRNQSLAGVSARNYVFMALAAQQREKWEEVLELGHSALEDLAEIENESDPALYARDRDHARLIMAKAYRAMEEPDKAAGLLFDARDEGEFGTGPELYAEILDMLRDILYDKRDYIGALEAKQEKYSLEHEFGVRAFIGAGRVIRRKDTGVASEIQALGRREDLDRIIKKIRSSDCRLLIVHGLSGVGKSSILEAGAEPALKKMSIETRCVVSVITRSYTVWAETLLQNICIAVKPPQPRSHALRGNADRTLRVPDCRECRVSTPGRGASGLHSHAERGDEAGGAQV
ncbi:MAG: AAA family ATPase, partial [Desulfobacteraceae bacterium]|nr:AAA family ATPase [Desulfobacteraceae bacterium]